MTRRRVLAVLLSLGLAESLLGAPVALAHDHIQPQVFLTADGARQNPYIVVSQWVRKTSRGCLILHGDGPYEFPPALPVSSGPVAFELKLQKPQRPSDVQVRVNRLDPSLAPRITEREIEVTLKRIRRKGVTIAWAATWTAPVLFDYYMDVLATWKDRSGCRSPQYLQAQFHVRSPKLP